MIIRPLTSGEEAAHDRYVLSQEQGTFFHLTGWRDHIVQHLGHQPLYLIAEVDGVIRGTLPLFEVRSPLLGRAMISVPYAVYGGVLTDEPDVAAALLAEGCQCADRANVRYLELRQIHAQQDDLPTTDLYSTFICELPTDPEECLTMIPRKSRASTRQARDRHHMEMVQGSDLLDRFYELFVLNKRSLGSPVFSREYFRDMMDRFGDSVLLHGVIHEGNVIATTLSFVYRDMLMPYYSGSEPGLERLGTMNFLYWKLMEDGVKRGLRLFDFGRSRSGSGAFAFKKNMGFTPTPLRYSYYLRDGAVIPSVNPSNPKYDLIKKTWQRLPLGLVRALGPRLMRYLP